MSSFHALRSFNVSNFVGKIKNRIVKLFHAKFYNKKQEIIRNPYAYEKLIKKVLRVSNIEDIRNQFFKSHIFAYSNITEKENLLNYIESNCSMELEKCLKYADEIIEGKFRIFEKISIFKEKINWHYGFADNYNWDLIKTEKINKHPKNKNVDIKYVWELNRHLFMPYLGFAYFYTGDIKYALRFKNIINDWIQINPPLYGINWRSGLEISIRLISWISSLLFFSSSKEINNNEFFKKIFKSMFLHAYFLRYFYSKKSFNHTIGEIFGIYLFSKVFNKIKLFKRWEKKFFRLFSYQIHRQFKPDGTHIELSVNYHRFVLEFIALFLIFNFKKINGNTREFIEKMFYYLLMIIKPNGTFPLIGDSDDGTVLLLNNYNDNLFINLINLGSILFRNGEFKYISKKISLTSILLLGLKGYNTFKNLPTQEPSKTLQYFKDAGYLIIRDNWSNKANYFLVDFGEYGPNSASHCHSDITNVIFCYKGYNILNDSGTYSYNKSWIERNLFRGSKAHNILSINNNNQADIIDWFAWDNRPKIKRIVKKSNENQLNLICFHNGYKGFLVKRQIHTVKNLNKIIIYDKLIPIKYQKKDKLININLYLHFDTKTDILLKNKKIFINNELEIKIHSEHNFKIELENFYYSPRYGVKKNCKILNVSLKNQLINNKSIEIITEIAPINNK